MTWKMKHRPGDKRDGVAGSLSVLFSLVSFVSFQEGVQLSQDALALDTVDHAGFLHSLTPGRGAAQAVHANGKEQGSGLGSNIQNIANDGFFFDLDSHKNDLLVYFLGYYNPMLLKKQEGNIILCVLLWIFRAGAKRGPGGID